MLFRIVSNTAVMVLLLGGLAHAAAQQGTVTGQVMGPEGPVGQAQVHLPELGLGPELSGSSR